MKLLADMAAVLTACGLAQCVIGWFVVARFLRRTPAAPASRPPVTILRPLCGAEPLLEEALLSCFGLDYPDFQIVCGVQDPADPALAVFERVRQRFPGRDAVVVVDATPHGQNRKVANLINMLPAAKHEVLAISDSDLHVPADYLDRLVAELERPGMGLVTSLYVGLPPPACGLWQRLGATQITHGFLPGVMLARAMGRQDCLGSTTMLRRETLERTGGLRALADILAEDNVLGQRVRALGLGVGLADTVVAATVPEDDFRSLWQHETRWTRTIRGLTPCALAASALQYPLFWAALAFILSGDAGWSTALFLLTWMTRAVVAASIDAALRLRLGALVRTIPVWALPLRDLLSVVEIAATYAIDEVVWRGHRVHADGGVRPGAGFSARRPAPVRPPARS